MANDVPYLGSQISLISKSEIRYEGILYTIDTKEATVALAKVRSFGTEDRPTDRPIAPRDEVYEYIIFRGPDIKDIRVSQLSKPPPMFDPAIVQHSAPSGAVPYSNPGVQMMPSSYEFGVQNGPKPGPPFGQAGGFDHQSPGSSIVPGAPISQSLGADGGTYLGRPSEAHSGESTPSAADNFESRVESSFRSSVNDPALGRDTSRGGRGSDRTPGFRGRGRGTSSDSGNFRGSNFRGSSNHRGNFRGSYRAESGSSGEARESSLQQGRPQRKEPLKFESDFDFEQANEQFREFLSKFDKCNLEEKDRESDVGVDTAEKRPGDDQHSEKGGSNDANGNFYDKSKSFFDNISCEALERSKGNAQRPDWKAEKKINRETFGATGFVGPNRGRSFYNNRGFSWGGNSGAGGFQGRRGSSYYSNSRGNGAGSSYNDGYSYGGGRFNCDNGYRGNSRGGRGYNYSPRGGY